jgi:hypothetical protein
MTVKELKDKLACMPNDAPILIVNSYYEWYGAEEVKSDAVGFYRGYCAIDFSCSSFDSDSAKEIDEYILNA